MSGQSAFRIESRTAYGWLVKGHPLSIAIGTLGLLATGFGIWLTYSTSQVLKQSAAQVRADAEIPFTLRSLDPSAVSPRGALAVESVSSPATFSDIEEAGGQMYLAGPSGLTVYGSDGSKIANFHPGLELPSAPIVRIARLFSSGFRAVHAGSRPALAIVTAGEGMLLWDGRVFTQVRAEDAAARDLTAVLPVSTGRILLGTRNRGVLVWDGQRLEVFRSDLASLKVTTLAGDETDLWVGTLDQGVLHWHAGTLDRISEPEGLPDPQVISLAKLGDAAYVGTAVGVAEFRSGQLVRKLAEGCFARSLLATEDALWVGTMDEGVLRVALKAEAARAPAFLKAPSAPVSGAVEKIIESDGTLYALTDRSLHTLDPHTGRWQQAFAPSGGLFTDGNVSALAFDGSGRFWVGYFDHGLDIVEPGGDHARHIEDDHVFCVNRVVPQPGGDLVAVATANGLVIFNGAGREQQVLGRDQGLIANDITDVLFRGNEMAVATPAGITLIGSAGIRSLYAFQGLVNNHVYTLAGTGDKILAGTLGGLSVLEGGVVRANYTTANSGLRHNWINAVVPVGDGWFVGTYGAGVLRLNSPGNWSSFPDLTGREQVNPNAMLVTPSHLYAGTLANGLLIFNRASGRWTQVREGLPSADVTALAEHNGWIYVGTDNGLVRFSDLNVVAP